VHWPVIVLVGALIPEGAPYYVAVLSLSFGLAIASFHFVENPLRYADWTKTRRAVGEILQRRYVPQRSSRYAAIAGLSLVTVALGAYTFARPMVHHSLPPVAAAAQGTAEPSQAGPPVGPMTEPCRLRSGRPWLPPSGRNWTRQWKRR
jgi:hypothetical protein